MNQHEQAPHRGHFPEHHVTPLPVYFGVFAALIVLTLLTVTASRVDLGMLNTPIAMSIAVVKTALVILFFMHLLHSTRLTWVVLAGSFVWLSILFVLTLADYLSREYLYPYWSLYK